MYSPKISDEQIKKLYIVAKKQGVPLTKVVKDAIEIYLEKALVKK